MLEIKYDHKKVEEGKYEYWLNNNYFMSGDKTKTPFSMVLPPPNITGKLALLKEQFKKEFNREPSYNELYDMLIK